MYLLKQAELGSAELGLAWVVGLVGVVFERQAQAWLRCAISHFTPDVKANIAVLLVIVIVIVYWNRRICSTNKSQYNIRYLTAQV